jgi:hypothetical protein
VARKRTKSNAPPPLDVRTRGIEAATDAVSESLPVRPELWVLAAWVVVALEALLAMYLGTKQGGAWPIRAYVFGLPLLAALALFVGVVGAVLSFRKRPFATPQRTVAFCLLAFVFASASYHLPFPAQRSGRPSRVRIELPFEGEWTLAWGGPGESSALLATRPDRRFGMFFVRAVDGATRATPDDPRSAFALGAAVLAPCDGLVVRTCQYFADDGRSAGDDLGNYLVLEIAPDEYLFLTNLESGSICVRAGERVTSGQPLARVGFSAASPMLPEPHLGMHVQDTPEPIWGQSIPFYLHLLTLNGAPLQRAAPEGRGYFPGYPLQGDRVMRAAPELFPAGDASAPGKAPADPSPAEERGADRGEDAPEDLDEVLDEQLGDG